MDSVYRKGLTIKDAKDREFKVYEKPKENNFVEKIIIQYKKSKNEYGTGNRQGSVYKPKRGGKSIEGNH